MTEEKPDIVISNEVYHQWDVATRAMLQGHDGIAEAMRNFVAEQIRLANGIRSKSEINNG